jgi:copper(I)-binding protein
MRAAFLIAAAALVVPASAKAPVLHVAGWVRPTVPAQTASAAYLTIRNAGPGRDRLLSISTPAAARASLHSTSMAGGLARMRGVGPLPIAARQTIAMSPGRLHVMLSGLKAPLRPGQKVPLTLRFEHAGRVTTVLAVRMGPPGKADGPHRH